jgi:hypothetical protein
MNRSRLAALGIAGVAALVLALPQPAAIGQDKPTRAPTLVVPDAGDVAEIRLVANELFPEGRFDRNNKFSLQLSKPHQVKPVLGWLKATLNQSEVEDIKKLRMTADLVIVGEMVITTKDKATRRFELQPLHLIEANYRWRADIKRLKAIIKPGG